MMVYELTKCNGQKYRGADMEELAEISGVNRRYISEYLSGKRLLEDIPDRYEVVSITKEKMSLQECLTRYSVNSDVTTLTPNVTTSVFDGDDVFFSQPVPIEVPENPDIEMAATLYNCSIDNFF